MPVPAQQFHLLPGPDQDVHTQGFLFSPPVASSHLSGANHQLFRLDHLERPGATQIQSYLLALGALDRPVERVSQTATVLSWLLIAGLLSLGASADHTEFDRTLHSARSPVVSFSLLISAAPTYGDLVPDLVLILVSTAVSFEPACAVSKKKKDIVPRLTQQRPCLSQKGAYSFHTIVH